MTGALVASDAPRGRAVRAGMSLSTGAVCLGLALGCGGGGGGSPSPEAPTTTPPASSNLTTVRVAEGFDRPVDLQAAPGDRARLFVVEQPGRIRIVKNGTLLGAPFLDIEDRVGSLDSEQGLLGLAFHPAYSESGRFFVNYTDRSGDTHVAEFRVSGDPDVADPGSEELVLFVSQPFSNHNGGGLVFGPDRMLYIGLGDGGGEGDSQGNGQNLGTHLGKMLRIDVDGGSPYAIPADNPFRSTGGARGEIWAYGLRNPWRFSFDRATGDLYVGDVGQARQEEIDVGMAGRRGGENYGWNVMEGTLCYSPSSGCNMSGLTPPVAVYATSPQNCSVTGGVVYRGSSLSGVQGTYFYGDFCSASIRSFRLETGRAAGEQDWTSRLSRGVERISSFGVDADGEMYIVDYQGEVYRIVPGT